MKMCSVRVDTHAAVQCECGHTDPSPRPRRVHTDPPHSATLFAATQRSTVQLAAITDRPPVTPAPLHDAQQTRDRHVTLLFAVIVSLASIELPHAPNSDSRCIPLTHFGQYSSPQQFAQLR
jgi:hypothetical protein